MLITNLTFNLKIFEVFSHLHGNYKQDIKDKGDPILGESTTSKEKSWHVEICTQVNVIPLNKNLQCYSVINKATSIKSKNIGTGLITYACLY